MQPVNLDANRVPLIAAQQPMQPPVGSAADSSINPATSNIGKNFAPEAEFKTHLGADAGIKTPPNQPTKSESVNVTTNKLSDERCKDILQLFSRLDRIRK